jgi:hypothetical protein
MMYLLQISLENNALYYLRTAAPKVQAMLSDLQTIHVLDDLTYYKPARSRKRSLTSFSDWRQITNIPEDYLFICNTDKLEQASKTLEINFLFDKVSLSITDQSTGGQVFEQLEETVRLLLPMLQKHALRLDTWSGVRLLETPFAQPRPPRNLGKLPADAILDVIDTSVSPLPPSWDTLMEAYQTRLPDYTSAQKTGPYLIVNWAAKRGAGQQALASALSDRLVWCYAHSNFPIAGSYNEQGDSLVLLLNPVKHSFYTFYIPFDKSAFKALVPSATELQAQEGVELMIADLKRGKSSDGKALSGITLIFPSRALAIQYHDEALQLGFKGTSYPDSQGNLWNPLPAGNWLG